MRERGGKKGSLVTAHTKLSRRTTVSRPTTWRRFQRQRHALSSLHTYGRARRSVELQPWDRVVGTFPPLAPPIWLPTKHNSAGRSSLLPHKAVQARGPRDISCNHDACARDEPVWSGVGCRTHRPLQNAPLSGGWRRAQADRSEYDSGDGQSFWTNTTNTKQYFTRQSYKGTLITLVLITAVMLR